MGENMKEILVVDESQLFRDFLREKLHQYGFSVTTAVNGLDGAVKMRKAAPDLVIMDYYLSRNSATELLEKKREDPNVADVPVIMASNRVDKEKLLAIAKYGVKKFFNKPIRIDALLRSIAELLDVKLDLDDTPCMIEAHFNEEILFIEVARGLNREKIELLRYKIAELLTLYQVKRPKVLLMLVGLDITPDDSGKLSSLLKIVIEHTGARLRLIKILTNSDHVQKFVREREELREIEVTANLEHAMEGLLGRQTGSYLQGGQQAAQQEFLTASRPGKEAEESFQLRFEAGNSDQYEISGLEGGARIAAVDDDLVIQELITTAFADSGLEVRVYNNGREFVNDPGAAEADLVFLDLLMPEMDGFQVLESLQSQERDVPVIVLSAVSRREEVVKAIQYGVKSYLIKPLQPEAVRKKAAEVLRVNF